MDTGTPLRAATEDGFAAHPIDTLSMDDGVIYSTTQFEILCQVALLKCGDLSEYIHATSQMIRRMGFTDFSFTRMNTRHLEYRMYTTPQPMTDHYLQQDVSANDFVMRYCAKHIQPRFKSQFDRYVEQADFPLDILDINRETRKVIEGFGYLDYYNLPIRAANGNGNVMLAITAQGMPSEKFQQLAEQRGLALQIIARSVDQIGTRRLPESFLGKDEGREIQLRSRPLKVLATMAQQGLSIPQTAARLYISASAVNQHLKAARDALGARTNLQALLIAVKHGLID